MKQVIDRHLEVLSVNRFSARLKAQRVGYYHGISPADEACALGDRGKSQASVTLRISLAERSRSACNAFGLYQNPVWYFLSLGQYSTTFYNVCCTASQPEGRIKSL